MTLPNLPGGRQYVRLVANAETPAELQVLNGVILALLPADLAGMGSGPDNPGVLLGLKGYPVPGGPVGTDYLMVPAIPASVIAAFNVIPGSQGWIVPAARDDFAGIGVALINTYGINASLVLGALTTMYNAAVTEYSERVVQGWNPAPAAPPAPGP
jgi:hypothetical protein